MIPDDGLTDTEGGAETALWRHVRWATAVAVMVSAVALTVATCTPLFLFLRHKHILPISPVPLPRPPHLVLPPPLSPPPPSPDAPSHAPPSIYINHYDADNPLAIRALRGRSAFYFLILGDWGHPGGPGPCQRRVADLMKTYIWNQRASGRELLFIASTGDNFYWTGVSAVSWDAQWSLPYGSNDPSSPLYRVPWLAVLGNHDFGDTDTYAFCPHVKAAHRINGQAYAGKQFNFDRNPGRPNNTRHFWLPDFNYHYLVPEADLEVIAIDTNANAVDILGGDARGHRRSFVACGQGDMARGRRVVSDFLRSVADAGRGLLLQRARLGTARTVVILQHYPGTCLREVFEAALPPSRRSSVRVLCAYGHTHNQTCHGYDAEGNCETVLSGGGGGCCPPQVEFAGFAAVHLTDGGGFRTEIESPSVRLPAGSCSW